jgi:hypothetical protein
VIVSWPEQSTGEDAEAITYKVKAFGVIFLLFAVVHYIYRPDYVL